MQAFYKELGQENIVKATELLAKGIAFAICQRYGLKMLPLQLLEAEP